MSSAEEAFRALGLSPTARPEQVTARWRELAAKNHPDRGGDAAEFDRYRRAYEAALEAAQQPLECPGCGGVGHTYVVRGFSRVRLGCAECQGTGTVPRL